MSLHKFADMVAKQGRGDDSLLIHMTPDEVQRLQQFAEANGRSLTINPETGLPEAGMLSDLFKAVAPIALGAFLGPAGAAIGGGFMSAGMAGLTVGGLTTLATGSLSRGLMAGMGAYGGAGLADSLMNAGTGGLAATDIAAQQAAGSFPTLAEGATQEQIAKYATDVGALRDTALSKAGEASLGAKASAGLGAIAKNPGAYGSDLFKYGSAAASPILAGAMVPTTTKLPENTNPAYIRQKMYDPYTQTYKSLAPVKAADWGSRSFSDAYTNPQTGIAATFEARNPTPMAAGGIVALAAGGNYDTVREDGSVSGGDPILSAYQAGDYATANQLLANAGMSAQDVVSQYGLSQAQAADVAKNLGYTGDLGGLQYSTPVAQTQAAASGPAINSVEDLYTQILGRTGEQAGLDYWKAGFGDTIDANEIASFRQAAQAELANRTPAEQQALAPNLVNTGNGANAGLAALNNNMPAYTQYSAGDIQDYIRTNNLTGAGLDAAIQQFNADPTKVAEAQNAAAVVNNIYRNVLGRDADPNGLNFWTNEITSGRRTGQEMYQDFLKSAKANTELGKFDMTLEQASTPYKGYMSADTGNIVDEWVRNTLGREVTAADRQQKWYKDASAKDVMTTYDKAQDIYSKFQNYAYQDAAATAAKQVADAKALLAARGLGEADVLKQTGKTIAELVGSGMNLNADLMKASQLLAPGKKAGFDFSTITKAKTTGTSNGVIPGGYYGNPNGPTPTPGDITTNPDGTVTVHPNIPGRPDGGFTGMGQVKDVYTQGGGSLGYTSKAPKTIEEFNQLYNKQTGDSLAAYEYLMGRGANPTKSKAASSATGIMQPYFSGSTRYKPKYLSYDKEGNLVSSGTSGTPADTSKTGDLTKAKTIEVVDSSGYDTQTYTAVLQDDGTYLAGNGKRYDVTGKELAAGGGMMGYAVGGGLGSLGSYSDGGRLLKGPGDGVSDSIPATIGEKRQPARLADGEFVIPARIVSELGNGSTEAGAKKLYAMMDRVQKARGKTTGKNKVAANSRADKYLPA